MMIMDTAKELTMKKAPHLRYKLMNPQWNKWTAINGPRSRQQWKKHITMRTHWWNYNEPHDDNYYSQEAYDEKKKQFYYWEIPMKLQWTT